MFYKLIKNQNIIDISKSVKYYVYNNKNQLISTFPQAAEIIKVNGNLYNLRGLDSPVDDRYQIIEISEEEYNILEALRGNGIIKVSPYLLSVRKNKIEELSTICHNKIIEGQSIILADGKEYHFTFDLEDQSNINRLMNYLLVSNDAKVIYHSKDNKIQYISNTDFKKIFNLMNIHINYHISYFNLLRDYINNLYVIDIIQNIKYGDELPSSDDKRLLKEIRR